MALSAHPAVPAAANLPRPAATSWITWPQPSRQTFINVVAAIVAVGALYGEWPANTVSNDTVRYGTLSQRRQDELQAMADGCFRLFNISGNGTQEDIEDELEAALKEKKMEYHPDMKGGSTELFNKLDHCYDFLTFNNRMKPNIGSIDDNLQYSIMQQDKAIAEIDKKHAEFAEEERQRSEQTPQRPAPDGPDDNTVRGSASQNCSSIQWDSFEPKHENVRNGSVQGNEPQSIGIDGETMLEIKSSLHRLRSGVDAEISKLEELLQIQEGRQAISDPNTRNSNLSGYRRMFQRVRMPLLVAVTGLLVAVSGMLVAVSAVMVVLVVMLIKRVR